MRDRKREKRWTKAIERERYRKSKIKRTGIGKRQTDRQTEGVKGVSK